MDGKLMRFTLALLFALVANAQTKIDLAQQATDVDFTLISPTKPFTMGPTLPGSCGQGQMFFLSSAVAGQNVYGCTSSNAWTLEGGTGGGSGPATWGTITGTLSSQTDLAAALAIKPTCGLVTTVSNPGSNTNCPTEAAVRAALGGAAGSITIQIGASPVGTQNTLNFMSGSGIIQTCSNNAAANRVDCTPALDTAYALSRATDQAGTDHSFIATSGGVGGTFVGTGSPTVTTYVQNGWFWFVPSDHDCVGGDTVNIDSVGTEPLNKLSAGSLVAVAASDCKEGIPYMIVGVGNPVSSFRLIAPGQ